MPPIIIDVPQKSCHRCPCINASGTFCFAFANAISNLARLPTCKEAEKEYGKLKDLAKIGKDALEKAEDLQKSRDKVKAYCEKVKEDRPDGEV